MQVLCLEEKEGDCYNQGMGILCNIAEATDVLENLQDFFNVIEGKTNRAPINQVCICCKYSSAQVIKICAMFVH